MNPQEQCCPNSAYHASEKAGSTVYDPGDEKLYSMAQRFANGQPSGPTARIG